MISYFCLYIFRQLIQLFYIIGKDNSETIKNAGVSMMGIITMSKAFVCMSSGADRMISVIKEVEEQIIKMTRRKYVLNIYEFYTKYNKFTFVIFYLCGFIATAASIISPFMEDHFNRVSGKRPLPISIWLPFDNQKYYLSAYLIEIIDSNFGCIFTVGTDMFIISLMIFAVCQLKVLNYIIKTCHPEDIPQIIKSHLFVIT